MSVIKFMGEKSEHCLRMKFTKIEPIWSSAISPYKKRKEVLNDLYN